MPALAYAPFVMDTSVGDITADVRSDPHPRWTCGIMSTREEDRVASPGYLTFSLDNSVRNSAGLAGYYTPGHANCMTGWTTGIWVMLYFNYGGVGYIKFFGRIISDGIKVTPGSYGGRDVQVTVGDFMYWANRHELTSLQFTQNKTLDQLVTTVVANMPNGADVTASYATGTQTFPTIFDLVSSKTTAMAEFVKGAMSELGRIYCAGGVGVPILVAENRVTRWSKTAAYTLDNLHAEGTQPSFGRNRANRLTTSVYPRSTDAAEVVLGKTESRVRVGKLQTVENISITYRDPNNKDKTISGFDFHDPPEAGVDYEATLLVGGGGGDESAHLTATAAFSADKTVWTLSNNSTSHSIWVYLQVRGKGVYTYDTIKITKDDTVDQAASGVMSINWEAKYLADPDQATFISMYMLACKRIPRTNIDAMPFWANLTNRMGAFLLAEPGTMIHVRDDQSAINGNYFVNGYSAELFPGGASGPFIKWSPVLCAPDFPALFDGQATPNIDNQWRAVCWSSALTLFCAVAVSGTAGYVMTSPDGKTWTQHSTGAINNISYAITWSRDLALFVAVGNGNGNTNKIMTSPDGTNWTAQTYIGGIQLFSVCECLGSAVYKVMAVGPGTTVATTITGLVWSSGIAISNHTWHGICYSPELDKYVAVALDGAVASGVDAGPTFTDRAAASAATWSAVCWSPELTLFCAVARDGSIMTSPNGSAWTARTPPIARSWEAVEWSSTLGLFMAVASDKTNDACIISPDGINWLACYLPVLNDWYGLCWSDALGKFVAVSKTGTQNKALLSI